MGRDPRYILPDSLQHIVTGVAQGHHLLCPSAEVNDTYLGVLGKAQRTYGMTVCAAVVMSTHTHLLVQPRDGQQLADFMCFLKTNVAKEIGGRLRSWSGPFWHDRYHSTTVSDEEAAQVRVLRYVLAHGAKENLVDTVREWPGVHSAAPLIDGSPWIGHWHDRTAEYQARQRPGDEVNPEDFISDEVVTLSPLPCWQHLPETTWRRFVEEMVQEIDHGAAVERSIEGKPSLGVEKVLAQDPYARATGVERSAKPRFHTATREVFETLLGIWRGVIEAFYAASERLRSGELDVEFPEGTFPPSLPFVPFSRPVPRARGHPG